MLHSTHIFLTAIFYYFIAVSTKRKATKPQKACELPTQDIPVVGTVISVVTLFTICGPGDRHIVLLQAHTIKNMLIYG